MTAPHVASIPPTSLETVALRDAVERHRDEPRRSGSRAGEDGVALGRANARFLNACFQLRFDEAPRQAGLPNGVALAAVGSFGRGAVALRSDADVVLIVDTQVVGAKEAGAFVEALLYPLWDAGLAVGHQVLSAADAVPLAQTDLATATALLDLRLLAGDEALLRDARRARERGALRRGGRSARSSTGSTPRPPRATSASAARCTCSSPT